MVLKMNVLQADFGITYGPDSADLGGFFIESDLVACFFKDNGCGNSGDSRSDNGYLHEG